MIWALLAVLGVPIWLIVGILGGAIWNRRTFQHRPGVFKMAKRDVGATGWKRKSVSHARCISNVLVTNGGLGARELEFAIEREFVGEVDSLVNDDR